MKVVDIVGENLDKQKKKESVSDSDSNPNTQLQMTITFDLGTDMHTINPCFCDTTKSYIGLKSAFLINFETVRLQIINRLHSFFGCQNLHTRFGKP